jgi:phosphatidylglycerol:prolipoprotein diacylglycerol transferase
MSPEIFSIGDLSIRWYSVLILVGIITAVVLAENESKKFKFEKDFIFDLAFWLVIFGIIGARLYYVVFNFNLYKNDLIGIFKIWNGGLAIHGGIIAGLITLLVYCRVKKVKPLRVTDIAVPSLTITFKEPSTLFMYISISYHLPIS